MQAALALVLLLNGVQVNLPSPALRIEGTASVPLRAVCERLGLAVQVEAGGRVVALTGPDIRVRVAATTPAAPGTQLQGVRVKGTIYAPARPLAQALGGTCAWDPASLTIDLRISWKGPASATTLSQITADSVGWRGRSVRVTGMVRRGWGSSGDPSWALPDDAALVLGDASGAVRVARAAGPGAPSGAEPVGTKCLVRGVVGLLPTGRPWIGQAQAAAEASAEDAVTLEVDRAVAEPGDRVVLRLRLPGSAGPPTAALGLVLLSALSAELSSEDVPWSRVGHGPEKSARWTVPSPSGRGSSLACRLRAAGAEAPLRIVAPGSAGADR